MLADASTANQILRSAETLLRTRGYNAFSYADIAKVVGISTASIHYHFPSKADLVRDLIAGYTRAVIDRLDAIVASETSPRARLRAYVALFRESLGACDRMCACLMLGAEADTIPQDVRAMVGAFFVANGAWIANELADGRAGGEIDFAGSAEVQARVFCSTAQGAAFLARACGDIALYDSTTQFLLQSLDRSPPSHAI